MEEKKLDIVDALISSLDPNEEVNSDNLKAIQTFVNNFKIDKEIGEAKGYIAQAYVAARSSKTFKAPAIAKALGMNITLYKKLLDTDTEFAAAIRLGIIDGKSEMENELITQLYRKALGYKTVDETVRQDGVIAGDGTEFYNKISKTTISRNVGPDSAAIQLLLEKLDPSWVQKQQLEVVTNKWDNLDVSQDVSVDVDYRRLSVATLKELLMSEKDIKDDTISLRGDGTSVISLRPANQEGYNPKPHEEWETKKNKRKWTKEMIEKANAKRSETWKRKREEKEKLKQENKG